MKRKLKGAFRLILFLLSFQMEVRVKASGAVLESSVNCLQETGVCAVKVKEAAFHLRKQNLQLHAAGNSILERQTEKKWKFVKGQLWVEKAPQVRFQTVYGELFATQGEFWILSSSEDRILVRNISSDVEVTLRDSKKIQVPAGFQFWIAGLNSKAESEYGMIEPIDMKSHLPAWHALFGGSKEQFIQQVSDLREAWGDLVEKSSAIYQDQALRKIAAIDDAKKQSQARAQKQAEEKRLLRNFYHSRIFER